VPNVVSTSLIAGYLYLSFLSLHFTCPFHSQSFQKVYPNLATSIATTQLVLCWMCDSPRTGWTWRTTPIYQRWSDSGFLLSDPILFLKNDIRSESCFG